MNPKQLLTLLAAAVILAGAWLLLDRRRGRSASPAEIGRTVLAGVDLNAVALVEVRHGGKRLEIVRDTNGVWRVPSLAGYPADLARVRARLLALADITIGDVVRGMDFDNPSALILKDKSGQELAALHLGPVRQGGASGGMVWQPPEGRYLRAGNNPDAWLVKEPLNEFTAEPRAWVDTRLFKISANDVINITITYADAEEARFQRENGAFAMKDLADDETFDTSKFNGIESALAYLSFVDVLPASTPDTITGLSTGTVFHVVSDVYLEGAEGGHLVESSILRIGNTSPDGNRYAAFNYANDVICDSATIALPYIFTIPAHIAANMTRPRAEFIKPAENFIQTNDDDEPAAAANDGKDDEAEE